MIQIGISLLNIQIYLTENENYVLILHSSWSRAALMHCMLLANIYLSRKIRCIMLRNYLNSSSFPFFYSFFDFCSLLIDHFNQAWLAVWKNQKKLFHKFIHNLIILAAIGIALIVLYVYQVSSSVMHTQINQNSSFTLNLILQVDLYCYSCYFIYSYIYKLV